MCIDASPPAIAAIRSLKIFSQRPRPGRRLTSAHMLKRKNRTGSFQALALGSDGQTLDAIMLPKVLSAWMRLRVSRLSQRSRLAQLVSIVVSMAKNGNTLRYTKRNESN